LFVVYIVLLALSNVVLLLHYITVSLHLSDQYSNDLHLACSGVGVVDSFSCCLMDGGYVEDTSFFCTIKVCRSIG